MAINDCKEGLKFDDQNIKAFYRMTKAAFSLDKLDEAISYCNQGLKVRFFFLKNFWCLFVDFIKILNFFVRLIQKIKH